MHILLRPFTEPEYHQFFQGYEADPLMEPMPFVYNHESVSRSYHYNYHLRQNYAHFGIFLSDGTPVGCFQLKRINSETRSCEFGIILQSAEVKGRGIGTEAVRQGMMIARTEYGIETLLGDTSSSNIPMRRVFEKLGFHLVERVEHAFRLVNGCEDDRLVYRISLKDGLHAMDNN